MSWTISKHNLEPDGNELPLIRAGQHHTAEWQSVCAALLERWEMDIMQLARFYAPRRSLRADFAQAGRLALLRAAITYDDALGHRFENYARRCLRNALIDEARRARREYWMNRRDVRQVPVSENSLGDLIRAEACGVVRERVGHWVQRLRELVDLLYRHDLSQSEAARRLCLTPARVCQLCEKIRQQGQEEFAELADLI